MAGLGKKALSIAGGKASGGVPKMTKPAAFGRSGAASRTICPPRLQPTKTASSRPNPLAKAIIAPA
jgi:hypothetical protein